MKLTYYGHSCFSVQTGGKTILFDPFILGNELATHIDVSRIKADYILLSHGHSDHTSDAIRIALANDAVVVANYEIAVWAGNQGVKYHPMNTGGKWKFEFGTVKCVSAVHSSSLPDGTYGGNPLGFILDTEEGCFYYSGDTALSYDMKLVPEHKKLDFAVLPIGDNFTMGVDDAVEACRFIACDRVIGVHYDTFGYIKINKTEAQIAFKAQDIELFLPDIGQTIEM